MKPPATDPKQLLQALVSHQPLPFEVAAPLLEATRRWAASGEGPAEEIAALPTPLALAVLEGAWKARQAALPDALTRSSNKELAKAAKKALYQLRSMGVAVPEAAPAPAAAPVAPAEAYPALLSAMTGNGERVLAVVRPQRGSGLESFQVLFTDEAGIVELNRGEMSHGQFKRQLKAMRATTPPVFEISYERAQKLLAHAAALNLGSRTPLPPDADAALRRMDVTPALSPTDIPPPEPADAALATRGFELHDEPELAPWLPPEDQLRDLAQRVGEAETSPLELSPAQKREQLMGKIEASAREFFSPAMRKLYAGRLWEMAEVFDHSGRAERASIARAEARQLFHGAEPSRFGTFLFEKVVLLTARARAGKPLPGPGERLSAPVAEEPRTSGGLILP